MPDPISDAKTDCGKIADRRTEWAEDRTVLANARTFAAWMRTGMACLGVALGLKAVFGATEYPMIAKAVAELFVICAVLIFWAAVRRSRTAQKRLENHDTETQSHRNMAFTAFILTLGSIATGGLLWLL
ncbi:hypothetical protein ROA7745_00270 [Roseovarius aestuarii]|uniref:DUF202 domain-containing protein n=2 Tax=Roseovarius aestuarii TaxID=475083 RepID=A0A1X7BLD8_9RHOB|nr:hypothetical protein ROA7745_00270 [Roseovarius aestuarii]